MILNFLVIIFVLSTISLIIFQIFNAKKTNKITLNLDLENKENLNLKISIAEKDEAFKNLENNFKKIESENFQLIENLNLSNKSEELLKISIAEKDEAFKNLENNFKKIESENLQLIENLNLSNKSEELLKISIAEKDQIIKNLENNLTKTKDDWLIVSEKFENIAQKILKDKTMDFLDENTKNLSNILSPVREDIKNFKEKIDRYYDNENKDKASLKTEIKNLIDLNQKISDDANNLTNALKGDSKIQGNWGEIQLEKILDLTGLKKGIHYELQQSFTTEENYRLQPDCILKLPDNKNLIIDSKVSLVSYEKYFNSQEESDKQLHLKNHIDSIYNHIDNLSKKDYKSIDIKQPDFVLMFIPIESALSLAINNDLSITEKALNKNIILTSVSTMIATLRTITYIWRQEDLKNNFIEISKLGGDLYSKMVGFTDDLLEIGKNIEKSQMVYNQAMNKLTTATRKGDTIIGKAEKLKELGVKTDKKINQNILNKIDLLV